MSDIAWAAGVYEGEGSCGRAGSGTFVVQVGQLDTWLPTRLRELFGGSIYQVTPHWRNDRQYLKWSVSGVRARGFIYTIYKFLSPKRKAQIRRHLGIVSVLVCLLGLASCAVTPAQLDTNVATVVAGDDVNAAFPPGCGTNSNQNALGCTAAGTNIYTHLTHEKAGEDEERGFPNCVATTTYQGAAIPNSCLGGTAPGLVMTPSACTMYNGGIRGTETGSITFANSSVTWVAGDNCEQVPNGCGQNNPGLPNFTRVAGTHYLIDATDVTAPAMAFNSQLLMQVTTSGGAITQVNDQRNLGCEIVSGLFQGTSFGSGIINVTNPPYNASGEINSYTGLTCSGTTISGFPAGNNFINGQGIVVNGCGASTTFNSGGTACASVTPATPTSVTQSGAAGATSWCYKIGYIERDSNGIGGHSKLSSAACLNTVNTTVITGTVLANPVTIALPADSVAGVYAHTIWKSVSSGPFVPFGYTVAPGGTGFNYTDAGQIAGAGMGGINMTFGYAIPAAAPAACTNNLYIGKVTAGGGSANLTVTPTTTNTGGGAAVALHQDKASINAAILAAHNANANGVNPPLVYFPSHDAAGKVLSFRVIDGGINDTAAAVGSNCVELIGDSSYNGRSNINADVGPFAGIDSIGANGCTRKYLSVVSGSDDITPSQVGILAGAHTAAPGAVSGIFNEDKDTTVIMYDDPNQHCQGAGGGGNTTPCLGTIALFSAANDAHAWHDIQFEGSTALWALSTPGGGSTDGNNYAGITSQYDTIQTNFNGGSHSMIFDGFSFLAGGSGPGLLMQGQFTDFAARDLYFFNASPFFPQIASGTVIGTWNPAHPWAIEIGNTIAPGECDNCDLGGELEGWIQYIGLAGGGGASDLAPKILTSTIHPTTSVIAPSNFTAGGTAPLIEDENVVGNGLQHFILGNTFRLQGTGNGNHRITAFKIDSTATGTIIEGNEVALNGFLTWDQSNASVAGVNGVGGNVFHLTGFGSSPDRVLEPSSGSPVAFNGGPGDLICTQGNCTGFMRRVTPTVANCGGTVTPNANSSDQLGSVTAGGAATSCDVVFNGVYGIAPQCTGVDITTKTNLIKITNNTTLSVTFGGLTAGDTFQYRCDATFSM